MKRRTIYRFCLTCLSLIGVPVPAIAADRFELTDLPGISVSANDFGVGSEPANAIDNKDYADGQFSWTAPDHGSEPDPNWLELDFGSDFYLSMVEVRGVSNYPNWVGYNNIFNLRAKPDLGQWTLIGSGDIQDHFDPTLRDKTFNYAPGAEPLARYLRYEVVGGSHWSYLGEINVQGSAVPEPSSELLCLLAGLGILAFKFSARRSFLPRNSG